MSGYRQDFDWNPSSDEPHSIVVRGQPAIAVYLNHHDEIVVRQEDQFDVSQDHFVYVTKVNVVRVAQRMLELADVPVAMVHMDGEHAEEPPLLRVINGNKEALVAAE